MTDMSPNLNYEATIEGNEILDGFELRAPSFPIGPKKSSGSIRLEALHKTKCTLFRVLRSGTTLNI